MTYLNKGARLVNTWERLQQGLVYNDFDQNLFMRRVEAKKLFRAYNATDDDKVELREEGDVKVTPGVTIGEGTIIGCGSIVTKDIPAGVIAVGNPCHVLRPITEADKETCWDL